MVKLYKIVLENDAKSITYNFVSTFIAACPRPNLRCLSPHLCKTVLVFQVSHLDPLLDDSIQFAKKLRDLGKEVHIDCVEDLPHGFLNFILTSAEAKQASDICVQKIQEILRLDQLSDEEWEILDEGLEKGEVDDLLDIDDIVSIDINHDIDNGSSVDDIEDVSEGQ